MSATIAYPFGEDANPGVPSIYASEEEWAAYRLKQQQARDIATSGDPTGVATNQSGMTPQQMEGEVGTPVNPVQQALMELLTNPNPDNSQSWDVITARKPLSSAPTAGSSNPEAPEQNSILQMAFPEAFRKQPPTGQVNTEGGVERVNARTKEHGVTATKKDGKTYLTNINADGTVNQGTGSPNSISGDGKGARVAGTLAPNIPLNLASAAQRLSGMTDYAEARGIMSNIRETVEQQTAYLMSEAQKFASNKVGLPGLEAELQRVMQGDRNSYGWYPGIGDSPITMKTRAEIAQATNSARAIADDWLKGNTQVAALKATIANANEEFKRIAQLDQRKTAAEDSATLSLKNSKERKDYENALRDQDRYDALIQRVGPLTAEKQARLAILNPASVNAADPKAVPSAYERLFKENPKAAEVAMNAPESELPFHALDDNIYARDLVVAKEMSANPQMTQRQVLERLDALKAKALNPKFTAELAAFRTKQFSNGSDAKAASEKDKKIHSLMIAAPSAEEKKAALMERYKAVIEYEKATATDRAIDDASIIFLPTGNIGIAMDKAAKMTGGRNLSNVWTAYKALDSTTSTPIQASLTFNKELDAALARMKPSMFGMASPQAVKAYIIREQRDAMQKFIDKLDTLVEGSAPIWR